MADVGEWLGALGGLGMIALIAALLVRFLRDMGVVIPADAPRTMAAAAGIMLLEMMIAGLSFHMRVELVSLLDVPAVWRRLPLWPAGGWPFAGYIALLAGAWVAYSAKRLLGGRWMALLLAVPGAVTLFLPCAAAWIGFAVALALRLALRGWERKPPRPPYPLYLALLCALAVLSGLFLIAYLGGGAA